MKPMLGILAFIAFTIFGLAQIGAGFIGIGHELGSGWAWAALFVAFAFRFTLPVTIGAFYGAFHVWGWPWPLAALFALPGLALVIPGAIASIFSLVKR